MGDCVGIVIVSHSEDVANGAAALIRQMVGEEVPLGPCGGDPDGGLGSDVEKIAAAIDKAWSEAGVLVLYDIGGAETNAEMAIEALDEDRRTRVVLSGAPLVEGSFMAAVESSGGAALEEVRKAAEEACADG